MKGKSKMNKLAFELISAFIFKKDVRKYFRRMYKDHNICRKYTQPNKRFERIVAISGLGNSGSSAVIDYLREFAECTAIAGIDHYSGEKVKKISKINEEVHFLNTAGGLVELESLMGNAEFVKTAAIDRFIALAEYLYVNVGGMYNEEYLRLTMEFVEKLLVCKIKSPNTIFNHHLQHMNNIPNSIVERHNLINPFASNSVEHTIWYVKDMSRKKFRLLAREYIYAFLQTIESEKFLVLDHLVVGMDCSIESLEDYFYDIKVIRVHRDPRDLYINAIMSGDNGWIPIDVDDFIKWYRMKNKKENNARLLSIQFEDLIARYDKTTDEIKNFLGLDANKHIYPKQCLDPSISIKNIGLHKTFEDQAIMEKIKKELIEYCYEQ